MRGAAALLLLAASTASAAGGGPCAELDGARACFVEPTARYPHGVLGDDLEWGGLTLSLPKGRVAKVTLPVDRVFEDTAPRLVDLDGTGPPEIVVVESSATGGAGLAIYAFDRGALRLRFRTPEIGRPNRWLAPSGIADFDGDGRPDIAYVETPHLTGVLRVWGYAAGGLTEIAREAGFSNHRIGDERISGGVRTCGGVTEIVTADLAWRRLLAARILDGAIVVSDLGPLTGADDFREALDCER